MQTIVISILHFNNNSDTIACLDSIQGLDTSGLTILTYVLDNGSDTEFKVDLGKFKKINLQVVRNNYNSGFTGGHNLVYGKVQDKQFDYFLILNNDCILEKGSIVSLVNALGPSKVGAAVPKIYFTSGYEFHKQRYSNKEKGRVFWYAGGYIDWGHVQSRHIGIDEVDRGQYDTTTKIDFATGACLLLKKEVIKATGLFDERYFLYFEDADLSTRIIKKGFQISYVPSAVVWHNNAGSSGSGSELHDYYLTRNRMLFGMKFAPLKIKMHLIKESFRFLIKGRLWQKRGIKDYFTHNFGKGSFIQ